VAEFTATNEPRWGKSVRRTRGANRKIQERAADNTGEGPGLQGQFSPLLRKPEAARRTFRRAASWMLDQI
jgi:hypothetical protein